MIPIAAVSSAPASSFAASPILQASVQPSSAADLDRLRSLVNGVQPPPQNSEVVAAVGGADQNIGDSILAGVTNFRSGYNESLDKISSMISQISSGSSVSKLGSNFGEIMALQIEIARWTMSVTGVDNASKAGTNTIKELSKGG